MVVFKLEEFPFVCRMCFKSATKNGMIALDKTDPIFDGSLQDFITTITFEFAQAKMSLLPQAVCQKCFELLKFFAKFRSKLLNMHLFMNSLIELKGSNSSPMIDLFRSKPHQLGILFRDLGLCTKQTVVVEDLLNEFSSYQIAKMDNNDEQIDDASKTDTAIYAEECTADELAELIPQPVLNEMDGNESEPVTDENKKLLSPLYEIYSNSDKTGVDERDTAPAKKIRKKLNHCKLKEQLKCKKCEFSTYYAQSFRNHQNVHTRKENKKYTCPHIGCSEVFNDARSRKRHYENVHKPHICDTCGLQFSNLGGLTTHQKRHMNLQEHSCPYCGHRANTKQEIRYHINFIHKADYFFSCEVCDLRFKRKSVMQDHMEVHSTVRKHKCNQCDKLFQKVSALKRHKRTVHDNIRLPCDHCPRMFLRREVLRDHIEYVHGIQTRFICDICLQMFFDPDSLNKHKLRHDLPQELECAVCLSVFASAEVMEGHLCISYRDDYVCCGRDHYYHYNYNKHMLIKHGIRTNARVKPDPNHLLGYLRSKRKRIETCPKCEAIFYTRNQKKLHMETCVGPVQDDQANEVDE